MILRIQYVLCFAVALVAVLAFKQYVVGAVVAVLGVRLVQRDFSGTG